MMVMPTHELTELRFSSVMLPEPQDVQHPSVSAHFLDGASPPLLALEMREINVSTSTDQPPHHFVIPLALARVTGHGPTLQAPVQRG